MGFSPSLSLYSFFAPILTRGRRQTRAAQKPLDRPPGRLIWLHAPRQSDLAVISELILRLADLDPDLWFLLTTNGRVPKLLPEQCFHQQIPADTRKAALAFLAHWQPDLLVWASGELFPVFNQQVDRQNIPMFLLDTGAAIDTTRRWRLLPGLNRTTLRKFSTILSGDEATSIALISAGARSERVQTIGVLEQGIMPLPCNDAEWSVLAKLLATRPVWLAAEIDLDELASVLAAHQQVLRRSHRLLLIIAPALLDDAEGFASLLREKGLQFVRRCDGAEPSSVDQVYLADTEDEMGLWYRLAPVSFIGQTFSGHMLNGPNPFDAAALGSVVLHGPKLGGHRVAFHRLLRAGASRKVAHVGELAHAVEALLAPDRAAAMANAAWQIGSAGAEVMEKTIGLLHAAIHDDQDTG